MGRDLAWVWVQWQYGSGWLHVCTSDMQDSLTTASRVGGGRGAGLYTSICSCRTSLAVAKQAPRRST